MLANNAGPALPSPAAAAPSQDECVAGADPRVQIASCAALSDLGLSDQAIARYLRISAKQVAYWRGHGNCPDSEALDS